MKSVWKKGKELGNIQAMFLGFPSPSPKSGTHFTGFGEEVNRIGSSEEVSDGGTMIESEVTLSIAFSLREGNKEG